MTFLSLILLDTVVSECVDSCSDAEYCLLDEIRFLI